MNDFSIPSNAFIDPNGKNKEEVKQLVDAVVNLVLSHFSSVSKRSPLPESSNSWHWEIPQEGVTEEELLGKLQSILEASMNPSHPQYIGHMDSIPTLISSLGEFVSTSINNNMLSLEMSPVFSYMEEQVIQTIAKLFGYGENAGGVMLSGGTLANLQALTVARNHLLSVQQNGMTGMKEQPVILASEEAHTSLQKSAMILGIGGSAIIPVKTNSHSQMDIPDLKRKIKMAQDQHKKPFAIVATAGTTVTGNIDPISAVSKVAVEHGLWLHVDAAYGGALVFSAKNRYRLDGIQKADSITFNPQKWMYVAKTCAMVLFKDKNHLQTDFRIAAAPYMNDTDFTNIGEISVQGTRHADVLKLWLSLQHIGMKGYEQLIDENYDLLSAFVEQVNLRPYLELVSNPDTNVCCFRAKPPNHSADSWDQWNLKLQRKLLQRNHIFLSLPIHQGRRCLRTALLNPFTNMETMDHVFKQIDDFYSEGRDE